MSGYEISALAPYYQVETKQSHSLIAICGDQRTAERIKAAMDLYDQVQAQIQKQEPKAA